MLNGRLRLIESVQYRAPAPDRRLLGRHLVETGAISQADLTRALELQVSLNAPLGEILISEGLARETDVMAAVARQYDLYHADLENDRPEPGLAPNVSAQFLLKHRVVPWMRIEGALVVATARPDRFDAVKEAWPEAVPGLIPVVADEGSILRAIAGVHRAALAHAASTRTPDRFSCRRWGRHPIVARPMLAIGALGVAALLLAFGSATVAALSIAAVVTLAMISSLKITGSIACLTQVVELPCERDPTPRAGPPVKRPKVSILVPLYREKEIVDRLIARITRITYPKVLLDVVLVIEETDDVTREALDRASLPPWIRVIEVPRHERLKTKPRAMNYALDFCDGEIVGIWDAEDAPVPDQIERAVARFARAPGDVVCLQGVLDFYNTRANWITRCFAIEYAVWWRLLLPGLARMGLVVPLGGTTLFFRRDKLEKLGGWDAHNVTEDADLGVRLARRGYRTELLPTVTYEEATSRAWPWIKQRSRWLKGFMVTYLVHMRRPVALFRDLGPGAFWGFQCLFAATLCQFLLAPVLWSFWIMAFGLPHPIETVLSEQALRVVLWLLISVEASNIAIGLIAVSGCRHRPLMIWVPTLTLYFLMAAVASYKALVELLTAPFYWDKTHHGQGADVYGIDRELDKADAA